MKAFFRINILIWAIVGPFALSAQEGHKFLLKGDQSYQDQNFEQAELNYRRALEQEKSTNGTYNLGNSTYRQERYDEAVTHFQAAAEAANDDATKANAFHNLGNAHFQEGQFKESVEAYKNALRLNPKDLESKQNLLRAIRKMPPPQQDQQPQQGENQENQDQQQQDQQQQQQNQNDQQQDQEEQQNQQQEQDQNQSSKQQQQQSKDLSKEEAAKLLEIMDQEEQKVQEKLRKAGAKKKRAKDW